MNEFVRVKKIGEGSFGKALLVKCKQDGIHYVIKEINISKMSAKERKESRKEVNVLSKMKHPNIVSYIKSFEETGNLYIVMDYCDGGDLYKRINRQHGVYFTEDQVLNWFVQISLAIKHVHDRKILHRDIKTQNIFLTRAGTIKLGDFGIARVLRNTMELARTCIGTPYYLSPEICENRPYNNKSDVWSLGCVLYEMLTLKHAFEAGNMKNLVLKIIRGSYPPVPPRYSADVRLLVALLFKRNPHDRPSINTVLKKPLIRNRIDKFLTDKVVADEFSHTVLHRQPFAVPAQKAPPGKPIKPAPAPKKFSKPAAKYGVSVANKPANFRKPGNDAARKQFKPADREAEKRKETDAREKRRQQLLKEQEDAYNKYMESVQQQRWQKQQMEKINKAKEQNWRNSGNILSPEKDARNPGDNNEAGVVNKQAAPMKKYQNYEKENRPYSAHEAGRRPQPVPAWQAVRQGEVNRARGAEAAERARVLEEFWQRKRQALANKNRGAVHMRGHYPPRQANNPLQGPNKQDVRVVGDPGEENYLARLEAIRKQNYKERVAIQQRMAKVRGPVQKPSSSGENGDPRVDPEARRKKIAALKAQADDRAVMLKEQLEARRKAAFNRVQDEPKHEAKAKEQKEAKEMLRVYQRPVSASQKRPDERPVVSAVGLETALKEVGVTRLFRSHSEGDLAKIIEEKIEKKEEQDEIQRKQWGVTPFQPQMFPLEVTASGMEATSVNDIVIKPAAKSVCNQARQKWDHGRQVDVVSALGKAHIQPGTISLTNEAEAHKDETIQTNNEPNKDEKEELKKPVSWVVGDSNKAGMGVTVSVSKSTKISTPPSSPSSSTNLGAAVSKSTKISTPPLSPSSSTNLGVTVVKTSSGQLKKNSLEGSPSSNVGRPLPPPPSKSQPTSGRPLPLPPNANLEQQETKDAKLKTLDVDKDFETTSNAACDKPLEPIKAWEENPQSSTSPRENVADSRKFYQDFLHGLRTEDGSESPREREQSPLFKRVKESKEPIKEQDLKVEEISNEEEESFYKTAEAMNVTTVGLHTGQYDTDVKRLRTCSMPDLRLLFETVAPLDHANVSSEANVIEKDPSPNGEDEKDSDLEEEVDIEIACEDSDEENQDYFSMLESMEDVLVSEARSPSPIKAIRNLESTCKSDDDDSDTNDDLNSQSSGAPALNEDWDSDDSDEEEAPEHHTKQEEQETVFARLEKSRKMLEDELGFDRFIKVYKYIQSIQDNEDDVDIDVGPATEISDLLGPEHEHLYPKVLYLVMADSAYYEDNE